MSNSTPKVTPKNFFMWAGAMVALYVSVISFVALLFEYIERLVGDAAILGADPYSAGIRVAMASLIVVFPVYIILTRMLNQEIRKSPEKSDIWVRKWLIFLTVFLSAIALLINLIVLINTFLAGKEMAPSFLLKVLTIFLISSGVFYYYLSDIKGKWREKESLSIKIGIAVSFTVLLSVVSGFFIMGSPQTQRLLRYDNKRVEDLKNIQWQITDYYRNKQALPESLEELKDPLQGTFIPSDPQTNKPYEYKKIGDLAFTVCADFSLPSPELPALVMADDWRKRDLARTLEQWGHKEGKTCFERKIDPDKYKSFIPPSEPIIIR